jgi:hypothetical protein
MGAEKAGSKHTNKATGLDAIHADRAIEERLQAITLCDEKIGCLKTPTFNRRDAMIYDVDLKIAVES